MLKELVIFIELEIFIEGKQFLTNDAQYFFFILDDINIKLRLPSSCFLFQPYLIQ